MTAASYLNPALRRREGGKMEILRELRVTPVAEQGRGLSSFVGFFFFFLLIPRKQRR